MVIEELVKTVLSEMRQLAKTETVIGDPVKIGDVTLIPVSRLSIGFGVGGGQAGKEKNEAEATGGGATVEPLAFFVIRGDEVELVSIKKQEAQWTKLLKLVPDLFDKVKDISSKDSPTPTEKGEKE
ncbi:sporulation protein [bacterium]|nr:sporulation protein [bacterium]